MPDSVISASRCGISCRKRVAASLGAVAHHPLDAGAVVPAAVEDQHLAGGGQLLDVALHVELGLLAVGRRRQGDDAEHPRADLLGQALDHAALAGGVAALEEDDDAGAARLHPGLQVGDLDLKAGELGLVGLVARLLRRRRVPARPVPAAASSCLSCSWVSSRGCRPRRREARRRGRRRSCPGRRRRAGRRGRAGPRRRRAARRGRGARRGRRGRRGTPRASRRRSSSIWVMALASSRNQRVSPGMASAMATSRAWTWSALKNSRSPSMSAMVRPGTGWASGRRCSL